MKSRIASEAIKGQKTIQEIASHYGVHPNQVTNWKRQAADSRTKIPPSRAAAFVSSSTKPKLKEAERRDGYYLLRSNLTAEDSAVLWSRYVQLTQIEAVFRSLKSELGIRPIYHQKEDRTDAHICDGRWFSPASLYPAGSRPPASLTPSAPGTSRETIAAHYSCSLGTRPQHQSMRVL